MHALVISSRSHDRYVEAEVVLKSIFFNRDNSAISGANHRHSKNISTLIRQTLFIIGKLVIHLVVDDGGFFHFQNLWSKYNLLQAIPDVVIVFHSFQEVKTYMYEPHRILTNFRVLKHLFDFLIRCVFLL